MTKQKTFYCDNNTEFKKSITKEILDIKKNCHNLGQTPLLK